MRFNINEGDAKKDQIGEMQSWMLASQVNDLAPL